MKINRGSSYYLLLLLFPAVFLLHNVNENFGLTALSDVLYLLFVYMITSLCIAFVSKRVIGRYPHAFVYSFLLLVINFLFGVFKDFVIARHIPAIFYSYKYLLPLLFLMLMLMAFYLRKTNKTFTRLSQAIAVFLLLNMVAETGWYMFNVLTKAATRSNASDRNIEVKNIKLARGTRKPTVFWIVFDEYSSSSTLKKVWGFSNPLDSLLKSKGFYIPDAARSNYNYTHYSVSSTLDMNYLKGLANHSVVHFRDRRKEEISIYDNNTVRAFENNGYSINNFSIFQLRNHVTRGIHAFSFETIDMINFQTLAGRVRSEIGWNFPTLFKMQKHNLDSLIEVKSLKDLDSTYKDFTSRCLVAAKKGAGESNPAFYMFHFLHSHEPFMYNPDGSIAFKNGYHDSAKQYVPQIQYTNTVIKMLADSLLSYYRNKDFVIVLQSDHALKFHEDDPMFDQESCKILYAVYCSDGDYSLWPRSLSSVNGFRILFNKYFHARLALLPDSSYNLYEH